MFTSLAGLPPHNNSAIHFHIVVPRHHEGRRGAIVLYNPSWQDEHLGLESTDRCLGMFYLGYPSGPWPERTPGPIADKVQWRRR